MVSWFSEEYHQSRNCRKNTPTDRLVERDKATPPTAFFRADFILSPTLLGKRAKGRENSLFGCDHRVTQCSSHLMGVTGLKIERSWNGGSVVSSSLITDC